MIIIALILIHTQEGDHPEAPTCEILLMMRNIHVALLPGLVWITWVNKEKLVSHQTVNLAYISLKGLRSCFAANTGVCPDFFEKSKY